MESDPKGEVSKGKGTFPITVIIPTFNSASTLSMALDSLKRQTFREFQVLVVDSFSTDRTRQIAKDFGAEVLDYPGKTLGARANGVRHSTADYYLLLDSDQVLKATTLQRCMDAMGSADYLVLEEHTYCTETFVERLFEADRNLIHADMEHYMDQTHGILCPRFFRGTVLRKAVSAMPDEIIKGVQAYDDAILTLEVRKVTKRVGLVRDAVKHMEPSDLRTLWRKNLKYGRSARKMVRLGYYPEVFQAGARFRSPRGDMFPEYVRSLMLLVLKAIPYQIGYLTQGR